MEKYLQKVARKVQQRGGLDFTAASKSFQLYHIGNSH